MQFNTFHNYNQVQEGYALGRTFQNDSINYPNEVQPFYQFQNELENGYNQIDYAIRPQIHDYPSFLPQNYQISPNGQPIEQRSFLELEPTIAVSNIYDAFNPFESPNYMGDHLEFNEQGRNNEINDKFNIALMQEQQRNLQQIQTTHNQNSYQQPLQENSFTTMQTQLRNHIAADIYQNKESQIANNQQQTTQNFYQSYQVINKQINSQQQNEVQVVGKESAKCEKKLERKPSNKIYTQLKYKEDETKNLLRNYGDQLKKEIKQMSLEKKDDSLWIEQILDNYMDKKNIDNQNKFRENFILKYKDFSFSNFQVVREEWTVSPNQHDYHLKNVYRQVCFHFFTKQPLRYIYKNSNKINNKNQRFTHLYYLKVFIQGILDPKKFQKFKDSKKSKKDQTKDSQKNNQD
ncbi:hypothetical protein TTHERM_00348020 (macronuclear) [Tetrahymena thermophila SB210]|uniref:Uncharacterized protein n=1 Tax=Tetrahymena thermophila (strain SB210) TaxID=312017 RepID=I7MLM6_TETTS|nr:hypothetical protein TTHERM_00348020 [Tetrahymena thermophila SB210]EAS02712.1 hypothetical protein TTHERM_00348020 [Tetrahymena thermophila SB210]|eukprot:XP_001022957.1 hypothetical protein TTHERM_00348020 [Tetrahymena thermophila SB210]